MTTDTKDATATPHRRLAVVISHPIQHFAPLFRDLAKQPGIDLRVFYCCDWGIRDYQDPDFGKTFKWDIPLLEGYESEFLEIAKRPTDLSFFSIDNPSVSRRLSAFDADAVWVHGYGHRTSWRVRQWACRHRRRILYFGDSELLAARRWTSRLLKRLILPGFFSKCDSFLTIGDNNEAYYRHYGVPDQKMIRGAFPVDVSRFQAAVQAVRTERSELRAAYGLVPDSLVALFVGKFISIKRPLDLVMAMHGLRNQKPGWQVLMLGSGPLEGEIRQRISDLNLQDCVLLPGFVNQAELPRILALGDVLVMPSEKDPHPLVVSEAMAVGNAVVASDRVGCVGPTDAARPERNALQYPCGDVSRLTDVLTQLANDSALLKRFQEESTELAWTQDVSVMVRAVMQAMECER